MTYIEPVVHGLKRPRSYGTSWNKRITVFGSSVDGAGTTRRPMTCDTLMMCRFTDNARGAMRTAFRNASAASEREVIVALTKCGLAARLLQEVGVTPNSILVDGPLVQKRLLVTHADARRRGLGEKHVGTEHLLLALASMPGSALAACGASAERLGRMALSSKADWQQRNPPIARRIVAWCLSVCAWRRG